MKHCGFSLDEGVKKIFVDNRGYLRIRLADTTHQPIAVFQISEYILPQLGLF